MSSITQSSTSSGCRVEHQPGLQPSALMACSCGARGAGVGVEADEVGAGLGKGLRPARPPAAPSGARRSARACRRASWQRLERLANHRPKGEVGHVMVVHHVEVDPVGAGVDDGPYSALSLLSEVAVKLMAMGEFELIERYFKRPAQQAAVGIGDDCAIWTPRPGHQLAFSADMLVEGRHFLPTVNPQLLGSQSFGREPERFGRVRCDTSRFFAVFVIAPR
jgi:hypothetical protein